MLYYIIYGTLFVPLSFLFNLVITTFFALYRFVFAITWVCSHLWLLGRRRDKRAVSDFDNLDFLVLNRATESSYVDILPTPWFECVHIPSKQHVVVNCDSGPIMASV